MFKSLIITLLSTSVLGNVFHMNVEHDFGAMLARGDALAKRQGYYPTTRPCGKGSTCPEACGAGTEQCPSKSGLYCHNPSTSACCPDNSGKACNTGYFCTTDGKPNPSTYCCPNGMDLDTCAKQYSLTVSLIRQTSTPVPSSSTGLSTPGSASATMSSLIHVTSSTSTAGTGSTASTTVTRPSSNTTVATSAPSQFTGAGSSLQGAGIAIVAGVAGLARFL